MTSPIRPRASNAPPLPPGSSQPLPGQAGAPYAGGQRRTRTAEQAVLTPLADRLPPSMRNSPPRRNTLPPAATLPPDLQRNLQEVEASIADQARIREVRAELEAVLATRVLQQRDAGTRAGADDDDEIQPRLVPTALPLRQQRPQIPAGEASSRPPLPVLPTSPQLIGPMRAEIKTKNRGQKSTENLALNHIEASVRHALQDPALRQALQAQGIVLHTNELNEQGQLKERKLTPLLEAAGNKARTYLAGLSDADMSPLDQAVFMTAIIREQLGQVMAVNEQGQPMTAVVEDPLNPGESAALQAPRRLAEPESHASYEKKKANSESGQLQRLAADYAGAVLGLDGEHIEHLRQRAIGGGATQLQAFQLKLRDLGNHQGPLAMALILKLYDPVWVAQQVSRKDVDGNPKVRETTPTNHRQALIDALLRLPEGVMPQLIAAAGSHDPDAMAQACKDIETAAVDTALKARLHFPGWLHHALERVQGRDYEPADTGGRANILNNAPDVHMPPASTAYAGAPPADEALRWLKSKAQASAQPMPER
jgi:hypothetical protein